MKTELIAKNGETTDLITVEKYLNDSQQRVLKVLSILAGHDITGLSITQIATALNEKNPTIYRDLKNLEVQDFVERVETDVEKWRHGMAFRRLYQRNSNGLLNIMKQMIETAQSQQLN